MGRPSGKFKATHSEGNSSLGEDQIEAHFDQSGGRRQLRDSELDSYDKNNSQHDYMSDQRGNNKSGQMSSSLGDSMN